MPSIKLLTPKDVTIQILFDVQAHLIPICDSWASYIAVTNVIIKNAHIPGEARIIVPEALKAEIEAELRKNSPINPTRDEKMN